GHTEIYELQPLGERRYNLTGWRRDTEGRLQVSASHLPLNNHKHGREHKLPRVWRPWRSWFEEWRHRAEPSTDRTYDGVRKRSDNAARRTMDDPSLATP